MEIIKRFFQPILLVNFILTLFCVCGFVYQVYLIFNKYMLGKTVVNLELKLLKDQPLPAITICIPYVLSISNLTKLNNFNPEYYQDYINLVKESNINKTFKEIGKRNLLTMYIEMMNNNFDKIENLDKLFELSISHGSINIKSLKGINKTQNLINESFIQNNQGGYYKVNEIPIYSFAKNDGFLQSMKCFTYFSVKNAKNGIGYQLFIA